ncbi:MAG: hypothetical protein AAB473_00890 [Patescibacteria group bacterium]
MLKKQRDFLRIRHAKEYIDGVRKNPFFFKAPPKRWLMIGAGALIMAAGITAAVGITYIPMFHLTEITVSGTTVLNPDDIHNAIQDIVTNHGYPLVDRKNVYLIKTSAIEARLMQTFPLDSVSVTRNGTVLEATVKEKITTVVLRTKEKTIFLGLDGAYVRDATAEESHAIDIRIGSAFVAEGETPVPLQADMPIILDTQNDPATSLSVESISHVLDIVALLKQRGTAVVTFTFDGATALFTRVNTDQSYDLFFDLNHPVDTQIATLAAIVNTPGFSTPSEYVDLRFGAYVYVK